MSGTEQIRPARPRPAYVVDTNVLVRTLQADAWPSEYQMATNALEGLARRDNRLFVTPLILAEFWSVATRNPPRGLGLTSAEADRELARIEGYFARLSDAPTLYDEWRALIVAHNISGPDVYDAYIAAALRVHAIPRLLTFNDGDFRRYGGFVVVHPQDFQTR